MKFEEQYSEYKNDQLVAIIENANDYQKEAVDVAKNILDKRKITTQEYSRAKEVIIHKEKEKALHREQNHQFETKTINYIESFVAFANPFQENIDATTKTIKWITLVFIFISFFNIYALFIGYLFDLFYSEPLSTGVVLYILTFSLPGIIIPIATILFGLQKKIGWILLTSYISIRLGTILLMWGLLFKQQINDLDIPFDINVFGLSIPPFILYTIILWLISKNKIRSLYRISKAELYITIAITLAFSLIFGGMQNNFF